MPNPHRGEVIVKLGENEKEYVVRIGNNEVCEIEQGLHLPISEWGEGGFRLIREILYVGLQQHSKRRMTRQRISALIDKSDMAHVGEMAGLALKLGMPDEDEDENEGTEGEADTPPLVSVPGAKEAG